MDVDTGLLKATTISRTMLVEATKRPTGGWPTRVWWLAVFGGVYAWIKVGPVGAILCAVCAVVLYSFGVVFIARCGPVWERLYYCDRCNLVFDPDYAERFGPGDVRRYVQSIALNGAARYLFMTSWIVGLCILAVGIAVHVRAKQLSARTAAYAAPASASTMVEPTSTGPGSTLTTDPSEASH
jgi:hypothetical protein